MGRGAYDLTSPKEDKSAIARDVLEWEEQNRKKKEDADAVTATEDAVKKLIKSKKSRGIMAARRAEKEAAMKSEPADDR